MNKMLRYSQFFSLLLFFITQNLFSQSQNIALQSQWNEASTDYNDVWGYVDDLGKEYAIIGSKTKIHFLNISNPTAPALLAAFAPGSNTSWRDIKTYSHYAYAVSEGSTNEGLVIFDLCSISEGNIEQVYQQNTIFGKAHNIFIDPKEARLYVVGSNTQSAGVIIYDLSVDASNPTLLANTSLPGGYIHDIFIKDNMAYASHGNNGLFIYDFSNPTTPIPKATINTGGYNHSSWVFGKDNLLIYAQEIPTGLPLGILDYSNYADNDLKLVNSFKAPLLAPTATNNTPHNPYMLGEYAVVSYYEDGVVIFDLSDPLNPSRVAYFDTYPTNTTYNGYAGCWGVYPFLPSGNLLASDISNGLFILKPNFSLPSTCNNGQQDWNESNIDCGGVCKLCVPCVKEICGNNIDDDRNGLTDCEEAICDCLGNQTVIQVKVLLEGFFDENADQMSAKLYQDALLPEYQPFKIAPFLYEGKEKLINPPATIIDWVLIEARDANQLDIVLSRKAALVLSDGSIMQADGTMGVQFADISASAIHLVVRHKGHLAIMSSQMVSLANNTAMYDFTIAQNAAIGNGQLKQVGNKFVQYVGDFDQNGIINNLDFNIWKQNSALINRYVPWDADGNGVINNQDFNYWTGNRSKVGEPTIKL